MLYTQIHNHHTLTLTVTLTLLLNSPLFTWWLWLWQVDQYLWHCVYLFYMVLWLTGKSGITFR